MDIIHHIIAFALSFDHQIDLYLDWAHRVTRPIEKPVVYLCIVYYGFLAYQVARYYRRKRQRRLASQAA